MCGIAGYIHYDNSRPASIERLGSMTDSLRHRGPDGEGLHIEKNLALGHRRLSIIDLESGAQPMFSADRNQVIVFNGEIYNYRELRKELEHLGHRFHTQSDTEVLLAAYRQWGRSCVHHLNGMWAFALWDEQQHSLFCSRDRLGEKPFFYALHDNSFIFASEIKALHAYGVAKELNPEVLDAYLCFTYIPAPYTFYQNIWKLKPGHNLLLRGNTIHIEQYWDIPLVAPAEARRDEHNIAEEFSSLFHDSVAIRMRSDVPFGAFLSGGLDSASVVAAMSTASTQPVQSFTIGFAQKEYDERHLARAVAQRFGTQHNESEVTPEDAEQAMATLAWHYDEPFGDSSALPTYIVSGIARKHVTMVLTGDGGDEVLSGYTIHQGEKFSQQMMRLPAVLRNHLLPGLLSNVRTIMPVPYRTKLLRAENILRAGSMDFLSRLASKQNGFSSAERHALLSDTKHIRPAMEYISEALQPAAHLDSFSQLNYWLTKVSLPDDMLTKVDRASMAHSLEARVPFLDHRIVELMAGVSMDVKLKGYTRKHILRSTMGKMLPPELLSARKRGFVVPLRDWMRNGSASALSKRALYAAQQGVVRSSAVQRITEQHQQGNRDAANALWTLSMLSYAV